MIMVLRTQKNVSLIMLNLIQEPGEPNFIVNILLMEVYRF